MGNAPSVNTLALAIFMDLKSNARNLGLKAEKLPAGPVVIDATGGNYVAGTKVGEICMGGLGNVELTSMRVDDIYLPAVNVHTSNPVISCIASQYAGWQVKVKDEQSGKSWKSMSSGPARARARVEKELFERIGYADEAQCAVIVFETSTPPTAEVMDYVAKKCNVDPKDTSAVWAPTKSIVGSVQISARVVETAIHKVFEVSHQKGFKIEDKLRAGQGIAPIAPLAKDDLKAMGRTNDAILAGGNVNLTVDVPKEDEDKLWEVMASVPSSTAKGYGEPFYTAFKAVEFDFYKIDPGIFAPAVVIVNNVQTGKTKIFGKLDAGLLKKSFFD
nr:methenyltetrahydromethanopterin cyclohydrolase [Candidatus Sigynarchaeum springense]